MSINKNLRNFFNLSIIFFILSFILFNIFSFFFSINLSLKLVLILLFIYNFFRLKKIYLIDNSYKFFLYFLLLMIISRFIEFYIFNFVYLILLEKNISWLITISVSFLFKFLYLELLSFLKKKN